MIPGRPAGVGARKAIRGSQKLRQRRVELGFFGRECPGLLRERHGRVRTGSWWRDTRLEDDHRLRQRFARLRIHTVPPRENAARHNRQQHDRADDDQHRALMARREVARVTEREGQFVVLEVVPF